MAGSGLLLTHMRSFSAISGHDIDTRLIRLNETDTLLSHSVGTDLVLNQRVVSEEELQAVADPQYILTPQCLFLRPMGGQPLPHGQLHQVHGGAVG